MQNLKFRIMNLIIKSFSLLNLLMFLILINIILKKFFILKI